MVDSRLAFKKITKSRKITLIKKTPSLSEGVFLITTPRYFNQQIYVLS
jgi:hypothetical protein